MDWTSRLFFGVLLTSVTGSLFQIIWKIFKNQILERDAKVTYTCLKVVVLSYMIPFGYVFLPKIRNGNNDVLDELLVVTPGILLGFRYVALVWLAIALFLVGRKLLAVFRFSKIRLYNEEIGEPYIRETLNEMSKALGVSAKISIYYNEHVPSPLICGILRPEIILPNKEIQGVELKGVLAHELTHYKNKDLLVKLIAIFINHIYCFNPMTYMLIHEIGIWSEMNCDIDTYRRGTAHFTLREYCGAIAADSFRKAGEPSPLASSFTGEESGMRRRIQYMKSFQRKGPFKKITAIALTGAFILSSSMTSLAAGGGLAAAYEKVWQETRVDVDETATVINVNQEYREYSDHMKYKDPAKILEDDSNWNLTRAIIRSIDWVIPSGSIMRTPEFKISAAGEKLSFTVAVEPKDKEIRMGIVEPNGTMRFIRGATTLSHTFTFNVKGTHRVYCENTSDSSVAVKGSMVCTEWE